MNNILPRQSLGIIVGEDTHGKKGKKNELKINEEELPSEYLPNAFCCLFIFLTVGFNVLVFLLCKWSLRFKAWLLYEASDELSEQSLLLVLPPKQKGKAEFSYVQEPNSNTNYTFDFQHIRYEIIDDEDFIEKETASGKLVGDGDFACRLVQSYDVGHDRGFYRNAVGLQTEDELEKNIELYGPNVFELPYPTFLELFQAQLESPLVCFQLMTAFLWAMDTYQ